MCLGTLCRHSALKVNREYELDLKEMAFSRKLVNKVQSEYS